MRKVFILSIFIFMAVPTHILADSYSSLWKKVAAAQASDLPRSQIDVLDKIVEKATTEKVYGQLIKAQMCRVVLRSQIAPDSLQGDVDRLKALAEKAEGGDKVLAAVYASILGRIYNENPYLADDANTLSKAFFKKSMQYPDLLAAQPSAGYEPTVIPGADSKVFYNDLLHVIGMAADDYKTLHDYYLAHGNRRAACLCAYKITQQDRYSDVMEVRKSKYLQTIDSLIDVYADCVEAGELAIEHYNFMDQAEDASPEDKMKYINYALLHWGAWPRMNILRNAQNRLILPSFHVTMGDEVQIPNRERQVVVLSITNVQQLTMNVTRLNANGDIALNPNDNRDYEKLRRMMEPTVAYTQTKRYIGLPNYEVTRDTMTIGALPEGIYLVEFSTENKAIKVERALLRVSNLYPVYEVLPGKNVRIAVVNATTGQPVAGAKVRLKMNAYNTGMGNVQTLTCDTKGEARYQYQDRTPERIFVYTDGDAYGAETDFAGYYSFYGNRTEDDVVRLFTDREIYRPGQTVHVAAVAYRNINNDKMATLANRQMKLSLLDANYELVEEKSVKTDEYGTAAADFTLPGSGLTGQFSVRCEFSGYATTYFSVEEYKRPTFEVEFDKLKSKYVQGDTVSVKGRALSFAGVPVQGAKVKYTVTRRPSYWWRYRTSKDATSVVATDTLVTDAKGEFTVRVPMMLPGIYSPKHPRFYSFDIKAEVTDGAGESRSGDVSVPLSDKAAILTCNLPEKIERDSLKSIMFNYVNNAGENVAGTVRYTIDGCAFEAKANEPTALALGKLSTGRHKLQATCGTDSLQQEFVLFTMNDRQPVVETHDWFYMTSNKFAKDGRPVYVQIGASDADQHIFYTICSGNNVLESGVIKQSNALSTRKFTYQESYGDGIILTYAWVKEGVLYSHAARIERPQDDKRLKLEWKTFRNRLVPGQKEEWTLCITNPEGKAAKGQLMAVLYDKSLDMLRKHSWDLNLMQYLDLPWTTWNGAAYQTLSVYGEMPFRWLSQDNLNFSHFDDEMFNVESMFVTRGGGLRLMMKGNAKVMEAEAMPLAAVAKSRQMTDVGAKDMSEKNVAKDETKAPDKSSKDSALRENLNETAFFYPTVNSTDKGELTLKFTLPESITTWRFMGLVHDQQMNNGMLEDEVVAKKTVMVQPNMPRFMRRGDKGQVAARLFNTSEKNVKGTATLELIDAETNKGIFKKEQAYQIAANGTSTVSFDIDMQSLNLQSSLLIARVSARGNGYSDGEQHYLPILSDDEFVTATVPFTMNEAGVKSVDLQKLFAVKDKTNRLTVEYTENPAWLMIQALPTVAFPRDDNAISLAAAYYANSIANGILKQSPEIKKTIEEWKQESAKETSLMSNLQKNDELKTMVLAETPWVAEAKHEADQKQQLINYFDQAGINYRLMAEMDKLQKLQNADGSFSWWPGMRGSSYMTLAVTKLLVRLNALMGQKEATAALTTRGFAFLDKCIAKEVAELKKSEKKGQKHLIPSEFACDYLYINALAGRNKSEDINYLVNLLARKSAELTIYGKANSAIILSQYGQEEKAKEYLRSLKEYSVYAEEMGRYFDTHRAQYSWCDYKIPSQVAAIEALKAVTPNDSQTIMEMQRWLLQEKRTQAWDTPINSVDAVYAFLHGDDTKLTADGSIPVQIKVDGRTLETTKATAGLGYVKGSMTGEGMKMLTVKKSTPDVSWGAVYAQFVQKSTDVAKSTSGLEIERELWKDGKKLSATDVLHVGDRISVRLVIKADRDYDFVQVQDKRAACVEPVNQLSGYRWGYYCAPKDNMTNYYFDMLSKGKHIVETEYYVDRVGTYQSGICTIQCAYSPEFSGRSAAMVLHVAK